MLIHIFTIVSVAWRDVKRVRITANYGKGFLGYQRDIENTTKHTCTVSVTY